MSLLESFSSIEDPRRKQGMRTTLPNLLTMVFLSYLCGYTSYRKIMKFCESCQDLLTQELGLTHPIPKYVTFREVLQSLDEKACIEAFNKWANEYTKSKNTEETEAVAGDGKVLRATVSNPHDSSQTFQSVVSIFGQETGLIYQVQVHQNRKIAEIEVLRNVIKAIKDRGLTITADALHAQKKQ